MACNENCSIEDCAPWKTRLSEISNYCEDYEILDYFDYWFDYGETIWFEMSYNRYCEDCLNYGEIDEWDLFLEESEY